MVGTMTPPSAPSTRFTAPPTVVAWAEVRASTAINRATPMAAAPVAMVIGSRASQRPPSCSASPPSSGTIQTPMASMSRAWITVTVRYTGSLASNTL